MIRQTSKRKKFNGRLKFQIALDALRGKITQTELARQYGINQNLIGRWKNYLLENGHLAFEGGKSDQQEKKVEQLENIIGKKEIEIQLLKKFLGHYRSL